MKTFTNQEGWTFSQHDRNKDLFTIPTETIQKSETAWVYLAHIASSPGVTRHVYFVDVRDGNAWVTKAQCKHKLEAMEKFYKIRGES